MPVDGLQFNFVTNYKAAGQYHGEKDIIVVADPQWTIENEPWTSWPRWWEIVAHEVAHKIHYEWFGKIGHDDIFYAILMAIAAIWDLHFGELDSNEDWYHPRSLRAGKQTGGLFMLMTIRDFGYHKIKDGPLFETIICPDTDCIWHTGLHEHETRATVISGTR